MKFGLEVVLMLVSLVNENTNEIAEYSVKVIRFAKYVTGLYL